MYTQEESIERHIQLNCDQVHILDNKNHYAIVSCQKAALYV